MRTHLLKIFLTLLLSALVQASANVTSQALADGQCPAGTHYDTITNTCR